MIEFLKQNYLLIIEIVITVIAIVIALIKSRPKTLDSFISLIYEVSSFVPELVARTEKTCLPGTEKKTVVIDSALSALRSLVGRNLTQKESMIASDFFSSYVEKVLEAPQKKLLEVVDD